MSMVGATTTGNLTDLVAGLRMRSLSPPIVPTIQSHLDTSNFDEYPMDNDGTPPDDVTGWDEKF